MIALQYSHYAATNLTFQMQIVCTYLVLRLTLHSTVCDVVRPARPMR
jgi:hypothetical protein